MFYFTQFLHKEVLATLVLLLGFTEVGLAQDPFAEHIRKTDPLTPLQQLATFKVQQGLTVELIASEPVIQKPLNMAFDWDGQLWVTTTREYPYPAELGKGHDKIIVLKDTNADGQFESHRVFADNLNIPIGILPYGNGCIVFDIPNISYLEDSNGDGKCDTKKILYGPFDYSRDTHGLNNSFRQGYDGWIYACHGFNNQSRVKGADGNVVQLNSGNTYRFKPDGSRIEHYSHGQVNPFGMAMDQWFRIFTADCHSKPLTQVVRNGYYPSFGAPSDGLGFAPSMMEHLHGSTAIAGVSLLEGEQWPESLRGQLVSGNVMTSRVNRNQMKVNGATVAAVEQSDLLQTTDPWFRPVDIVTGPDGSIYVADFYNRIIGHYEVPLEHPGRDRHRGRIWRIRPDASSIAGNSWSKRLVKLNRSCFHQETVGLDEKWESLATLTDSEAIGLLWQTARLAPEKLTKDRLMYFRRLDSPILSNHVYRLLAECTPSTQSAELLAENGSRIAALPIERSDYVSLIQDGLRHQDFAVRLAAVDAAGRLVDWSFLESLVDLAVMDNDPMLAYSARISLKYHLSTTTEVESIWSWLESEERSPDQISVLSEVALSVNQPRAASFVLSNFQNLSHTAQLPVYITFLTQNLPPERIDELVAILDPSDSRSKQEVVTLLGSLAEGVKRSGGQMPDSLNQWAGKITMELLKETDASPEAWKSWTLDRGGEPLPARDPWKQQFRNSSDGKPHHLISSISRGEDLTGILQSQPFTLGKQISFFLAGHRGYPEDAAHELNRVQLKLVTNGQVVVSSFPPRNDVAQEIIWDTTEWSGKQAVIEIVDGDVNDAYAWLAAAEFSVQNANGKSDELIVPSLLPAARLEQLQLVGQLAQRFDLGPLLLDYLKGSEVESDSPRYRLSREALKLRFSRMDFLGDLAHRIANSGIGAGALERWATFIDRWQHISTVKRPALLEDIASVASSGEQQYPVEAAISDPQVFDWVLDLGNAGKVTASVFANPTLRQSIELKLPGRVSAIDQLIANLPPRDEKWRKTVISRIRQYRTAITQLETDGNVGILDEMVVPSRSMPADGRDLETWTTVGKTTFTKSCSVCHQIAGEGNVVGPQLDGIGGRGLNRVLEDVLLPNENVDHAFRTQLFQLVDGRLVAGLVKERTNQAVSIVNTDGKLLTVDVDDIEAERQSPLSLMPEDVARNLTADQMFGLVVYLLGQKNKPSVE